MGHEKYIVILDELKTGLMPAIYIHWFDYAKLEIIEQCLFDFNKTRGIDNEYLRAQMLFELINNDKQSQKERTGYGTCIKRITFKNGKPANDGKFIFIHNNKIL